MITTVDETFFASATGTIVDDGLHHHPFTHFNIPYPRPDFLDHPTELVAKSHWYFFSGDGMRRSWYQIWASQIFMKVFKDSFSIAVLEAMLSVIFTRPTDAYIRRFDLLYDR